jgi:hypothetical protein
LENKDAIRRLVSVEVMKTGKQAVLRKVQEEELDSCRAAGERGW